LIEKVKKNLGFDEFSDGKISKLPLQIGCSNDCLYCHQKYRHCIRQKKENWNIITLNEKNFNINWENKITGLLQLNNTSDFIYKNRGNLLNYIRVIKKALSAFDEVQITTKADYRFISCLFSELLGHPDIHKLHIYFTITSEDDAVLEIFEPNAPNYQSRIESLELAFKMGVQTSLLIEPCLTNPISIINTCESFVSKNIWIGKMNYMTQIRNSILVPEDKKHYFDELKIFYKDNWDTIRSKVNSLNNPKIHWKNESSIKNERKGVIKYKTLDI
jgi:DNA repair photolyase